MSDKDSNSHVKEVQNEFSAPWPRSDVIFVVEGRKLHCNKAVLSMVSPVFEAMFEQDFKEKAACEVPLPEKKYDDMLEFFRCIHPHSNKDVTDEKVEVLLILADEYQCQMLTKKCRTFFSASLERCRPRTETDKSDKYVSPVYISGNSILRWLRLADQFFPEPGLLEGLTKELEPRMRFYTLAEEEDYKRLSSRVLRLLFLTYTISMNVKIYDKNCEIGELKARLSAALKRK